MSTAMVIPGNTADTFLVHFFGGGLADDRYVVESFKALADGDIQPWPGEAAAGAKKRGARAKGVTASRSGRPASVTRRFARSISSSPTGNGPGAVRRRSARPTRVASSAGEYGLTM